MQKKQHSILCYGDSNTWGYIPVNEKTAFIQRYDHTIRWTKQVQQRLGNDFYVIEEGLNGRTTNINHTVPPDRNGKTYLLPCLYSHSPLDLVILALGGNDLKSYYGRQAEDICAGMAELIDLIQSSPYGRDLQAPPKILLIVQGVPLPMVEHIVDEDGIYFLKNAVERAKKLIDLYQDLAIKKQCDMLDLTFVAPSSIDGLHLDPGGHHQVADHVTKKIMQLFSVSE